MGMQHPLWKPTAEFIERSNLKKYERWLNAEKERSFGDYNEMWRWSIEHIESFWESLWQYFDIISYTPYEEVLSTENMPGTRWFEGATLNYSEHVFRNKTTDRPALYFYREDGKKASVSWEDLEEQVCSVVQWLRERGIGKGDRVVAYLPTIPEATVLFLAVNSIGAIWSCCSPDFGVQTVIDRFAQIEPACFFAVNGYRYNGKTYGRLDAVREIQAAIPSIRHTVIIEYDKDVDGQPPGDYIWEEVIRVDAARQRLEFTPVPFNHPIWVLYSSGTTGKPKAIIHSHGGVLLEHLKYLAFHNDVHEGEHFFWYTTTGWMMWNFMQASLLVGAVPVLYDGSPGYPSLGSLWEMAAELPIHHFGTSAPFLTACMKKELHPGKVHDFSRLRSIGSTGSPLPPEAFDWVYDAVSKDVWLCSMSGGTDVCTAFVGGCPFEPVYRGRIQCRGLGCAMKAYNEQGDAVQEELGEMVIEKPMPSMPVGFWNDENDERYRASYFDYFPGVWRHGDWIKIYENGSLVIQGRSDATLNRKGVRIGTAEIYAILDGIDGIKDSLILNLEREDGDLMPLFVVLDGEELTAEKKDEIRRELKSQGSPRHVPDVIREVPDIPYTLSGKKMEVPVKKILMGLPAKGTMNKDAVRNPEAVEYFLMLAEDWLNRDRLAG